MLRLLEFWWYFEGEFVADHTWLKRLWIGRFWLAFIVRQVSPRYRYCQLAVRELYERLIWNCTNKYSANKTDNTFPLTFKQTLLCLFVFSRQKGALLITWIRKSKWSKVRKLLGSEMKGRGWRRVRTSPFTDALFVLSSSRSKIRLVKY